ncbi:hypothetical protein [Hyunsoonleella pacifica]|uniref:Gylcosyl hydrolase 115 C-terminal domain-containing protein n=1 Tax=Hyunsoonleella pacifica TaxID=1080224 RepID=A0A4Q9FS24_9FLAO|nr:hypothetical protein [Hyunsoonleella pacifica]TBN18727.1 hypothetical protein EYD46_01280 [Hyunsoonleella pacifica]
MKTKLILILILTSLCYTSKAQSEKLMEPIISESVIFEEKLGIVSVEAEFFYKQTKAKVRGWYRSSKFEEAKVGPDADTLHVYGSSNNAYIEILPDTRVTHDDELVRGENFSDVPGIIAIVHYKVKFNNPGRYYIWARAMSTGGEDNGIHVGLNGNWPESGQRMQWCEGKTQWTWASKQRTKEIHCGIPHKIYLDIKEAGVHDVQFSMREDGFEFDKFILTKDKIYKPKGKGKKVESTVNLPKPYPSVPAPIIKKNYFKTIAESLTNNKWIAAQQFPSIGTNFYSNGKNWMAINPKTHKDAIASTAFKFKSAIYDLVFVGVGENDGSSTFKIFINGNELGTFQPPKSEHMFEEGREYTKIWKKVKLNKGDKITVKAQVGTDGKEYTRGRWAGIVFAPAGKGKKIINAPSSYTQD